MKYKHIQLISLLIDYLTVAEKDLTVEQYLLYHGIRYPEKALRELALEVQERMTYSE